MEALTWGCHITNSFQWVCLLLLHKIINTKIQAINKQSAAGARERMFFDSVTVLGRYPSAIGELYYICLFG